MSSVSDLPAFKALQEHYATSIKQHHLRDLLADVGRTRSFTAEYDGILLDYSRQKADKKAFELLLKLAEEANLKEKIGKMARGDRINVTENRSVLHIALRAKEGDHYVAHEGTDGKGEDVVNDVIQVRKKVADFAEKIRNGEIRGVTGKPLTDIVAIGIGGSFLGAKFVDEALRSDHVGGAAKASQGRRLRFLANVDPVDVSRALEGLSPETTLAIIISKTFTTAETMLNARTVKKWIVDALGDKAVYTHMVACSTAIDKVKAFGLNPELAFPFWDWVGGRYSVTSSVGLLPLSIQYSPALIIGDPATLTSSSSSSASRSFLAGARSIDQHFLNAPFAQNLPVLLGLFGIWNSSILGYATRAIAPYSQALIELASHIQQVDMESNGKGVDVDGNKLTIEAGEIGFGQPGTNGQHSFFQLFHQGRVVPIDFIGFINSQYDIKLDTASSSTSSTSGISNHDELMCNFFAQPDALAMGQTIDEIKQASKGTISPFLAKHKDMPGDRPSNVILLPVLTAYEVGQLLALYEHRTAVQGFIWNINSFDQFGVELGKVLANNVRNAITTVRTDAEKGKQSLTQFNASTNALLTKYIAGKL